ncbi:MAG: sensor histidine kinase [Anaerolineales bacterium]
MNFTRTLRGRLLLSHLAVSLIGAGLIALFAGSTLVRARLNEAEHELEDVAFLLSNALEEPVEQYAKGKRSAAEVRAAIAHVASGDDIRLTVIGMDGAILADTAEATVPVLLDDPLQAPEVRAAFDELDVEDIRTDEFGREAMYFATLIRHDDDIYGVLRVSRVMAPIREAIAFQLSVLMGVLALTGLGVGGIGWALAESVARPISRITQAVARIAQGRLDERVPVQGPQEVSLLANAFNDMTRRLEAHIADQQAFVANASHELRTPLTTIKLRAESLRQGALEDSQYARQAIMEIDEEIDRLTRIVNDLLDLSRIDATNEKQYYEPVDLCQLAVDTYESFSVRAERRGVQLHCETQDNCPRVLGKESHLRQALDNLVDNAIKNTPPGGRVSITVARCVAELACVELNVADTGRGIAAKHLPHVYERFYRVDSTEPGKRRSGSGLGLAIVQSIVRAHGGTVTAESEIGQGTRFRITLPVNGTR